MVTLHIPSLTDLRARLRQWIKRRGYLALSIVLLIAFTAFSFASRIHAIRCAMPYPKHTDERFLTNIPGAMLKTGDFNPHFFIYPALPSYITAAAFTLGYFSAASHGDLQSTKEIGSTTYPYYDHPRIIWPAKLLYALLTIAAAVWMGLVAYRLYGKPILLPLVPLIASFSRLYFQLSNYMNVDSYGMFFVASLYVYLFFSFHHDSFWRQAVWPGALVGMAVASKYNLAGLALPAVLAILFYGGARKPAKIAVLLLAIGATFLACAPYTLLDFKGFLDDMGHSFYHYASGHEGAEGAPGWGQFVYLTHSMVRDFGYPLLAAAIVGGGALLWRRPREAVILLSFPALLFVQMSGLKVNFLRNTLSAYPIYAAFCGVGLVAAAEWLAGALGRLRGWPVWAPRLVAAVVVAASFFLLAPVQRTLAWAQAKPDSRTLATEWIKTHIPKGSRLFIPLDLSMDTRPLAQDYQLISPLSLIDDPEAMRSLPVTEQIYVLMPVYRYDSRDPAGKELADRLNRLAEHVEVSQTFTGTRVLVNYSQPLPGGDPSFSIGLWRHATMAAASAMPATPVGDALTIEPATLSGRKILKQGVANLPWNSRLMSDPLLLEPGRYEIVIIARGTPAKGENALLKVYLGEEQLVGEFHAAEDYRDEVFTWATSEKIEAPLIIDFVNDAATKDASGKIIEDRNAYLKAITIRRVG